VHLPGLDAVGLLFEPVVDPLDVDGPLGVARDLGHVLDQLESQAVVFGDVVDHLRDVPGRGLEDDHVEFDRRQVRVDGRLDALDHLLVGPGLGDLRERVGIDGVLGDVDPFDARLPQGLGTARQEGAVGRQRHPDLLGTAPDDLLQVVPEHRLATGELHLLDVELGGHLQQPDHLVGGHLVVLRVHRPPGVAQSLVVAVDAVEVTPVGQGDPYPGYLTTEVVDEHRLSVLARAWI
jgi:hypothetical protein